MPAYGIMRCAKISTPGSISASAQHTFRERHTPNADPSRTHLNEHHGPSNAADLLAQIESMLPEKRRKDAVLTIEHFFGASPEWWDKASPDQQRQFFERAEGWLHKTYGRENVVYFGTQLDERTPHAVAYVVPLRDGKLNAKSWLGGKERLRGLQGTFAAEVRDLGLERGIEGSKATHDRVDRFYGTLRSVDRAVENRADRGAAKMTLADRIAAVAGKPPPSMVAEVERALDLVGKSRLAADKQQREQRAAVTAAKRDLPVEQERLAADRAAFERERELFEKQRGESVAKVLEDLGFERPMKGHEYVGKLVHLSRKWALQQIENGKIVAHNVAQLVTPVFERLKAWMQAEKEVEFDYDRRGDLELRQHIERAPVITREPPTPEHDLGMEY